MLIKPEALKGTHLAYRLADLVQTALNKALIKSDIFHETVVLRANTYNLTVESLPANKTSDKDEKKDDKDDDDGSTPASTPAPRERRNGSTPAPKNATDDDDETPESPDGKEEETRPPAATTPPAFLEEIAEQFAQQLADEESHSRQEDSGRSGLSRYIGLDARFVDSAGDVVPDSAEEELDATTTDALTALESELEKKDANEKVLFKVPFTMLAIGEAGNCTEIRDVMDALTPGSAKGEIFSDLLAGVISAELKGISEIVSVGKKVRVVRPPQWDDLGDHSDCKPDPLTDDTVTPGKESEELTCPCDFGKGLTIPIGSGICPAKQMCVSCHEGVDFKPYKEKIAGKTVGSCVSKTCRCPNGVPMLRDEKGR